MQSWHSLLPTNTWVSNTAVVRNIHECSQFGFSPAYSNSYFCGLFYCIAARCPQNTVPIMSFPLTSSILASSPPLVAVFKTLSLAIPPPPSRPMIYYFFLSDLNSPSLRYNFMLCGGARFYFLHLDRLKRHAKDNTHSQCHTHTCTQTHTHTDMSARARLQLVWLRWKCCVYSPQS